MKVYWYWPFTREENYPLAERVGSDQLVHELVVSTIDRPGAWRDQGSTVLIRHDLPPVRPASGRAGWAIDRSTTYVRRAAARRRAVKAVDPDLVHVWYPNPWTDVIDLRAVQRHRPVVLHVHDVWPHERRLPASMTGALLHAVYASPDALVVYHESLRSQLVTDFGIPADRIAVIPMAVPPLGPAPPAPGRHQGLSVLFFGTFRPNKGLEVLIRAIRRTRMSAGVHWTIAGRGDPDVERMVREAAAARDDIDARIGWKSASEKTELYRAADVIVLPYTSFASQSAVLHDAYGHGKPVIVSDVGALGHAVREDGTGWVVSPGDDLDLAETINSAVDAPDLLASYGAAAVTAAKARSPDCVAAALVDLYARVLGH